MNKIRNGLAVGALLVAGALVAATVRHLANLPNVPRADGSVLLPNGWAVKPAGQPIALPGDMPLKMAFTADGKHLIVSTGGWHNQGIAVIDTATDSLVEKGNLNTAWAGLAVDGDRVYVSGGLAKVRALSYDAKLTRLPDFAGRLSASDPYYIAGVAAKNGNVWLANTDGDCVLKFTGDPLTQTLSQKVGYHPYGLVLSPDGSTLAVSNWGAASVMLLDAASLKPVATIPVGSHPNEMVYGKDGRLFVANGSANSVSVIKAGAVVETIRTSINPKDLIGSTPDGLAISPDGKTLYVANADNNDVAVVDISGRASRVAGFIPTGWYPSALAISPDGRKLYVGTGKGLGFRANYPAKTPFLQANHLTGAKYDYIGGVLAGNVSVVPVPDRDQLAKYTEEVTANTPTQASGTPGILDNLRKIKHVVYVIRENRTYDQVFGDVSKGNGDPNLVLFGEKVTPNAHRLANNFVLLDNLYCNGEVSQDGHEWCDASYATDYTEKAYVNSYSGRGQPTANSDLQDSPAGYIWDNCLRHHKTYMSYGEHSGFRSSRTTSPVYEGAVGLNGHASLAWSQMPSRESGGRDYKKVDVFIKDLNDAEKSGKWPNFMVVAMPEDHTSGLRAGLISPNAAVASNDLALGKMVDAISHSKFWKDTAIFVIEDDAQDGPDHVDAHRTVGLLISPYVKRNSVDSTMYTTASMVRTMEIILGLPPMTQFDEKATPMFNSFTSKPDLAPYTALDEQVALDELNPKRGDLAERSEKLDWSDIDRADPDELNRILWEALKPGKPMPAPVRSLQGR